MDTYTASRHGKPQATSTVKEAIVQMMAVNGADVTSSGVSMILHVHRKEFRSSASIPLSKNQMKFLRIPHMQVVRTEKMLYA